MKIMVLLRKLQNSSENAEPATKLYQVPIQRGAVKRLQPNFAICSKKHNFHGFPWLAEIRWWLLALLIAVAPFHAFLIAWLKIPGLSVWREVLVITISVLVLAELLIRTSYRSTSLLPSLDLLDFFILAFILLALAWLPFQTNLSQWALGFRFDAMPFLFFFFVRRVEWPRVEILWKIFFGSAAIILIFGLAHALALPQNFLTYFGYTAYQGEFQQMLGVPACQYLEHTDGFCRAMSTFGGPTRYGTYLLLVLGMLLGYSKVKSQTTRLRGYPEVKSAGQKLKVLALTALVVANIVLTFSRSIWIGLFAMGIFAFFWMVAPFGRIMKGSRLYRRHDAEASLLRLGLIPKKLKLKALIAILLITAVAIIGNMWFFAWKGERSWPPPILKTIFVRESSTDVHADLLKRGAELSAKNPLGIGLGTVGPASVRFQKLLTENWFLQIALELGWLGLALFLAIVIELSRKLLRDRENLLQVGLFLSLLGISVAGLFTHSFEETITVLLLMIFSALPRQSSAQHS